MSIKARQNPDDRKEQILKAALALSEKSGGFSRLTRELIAKECKCADGLISKYFGTMTAFRRTIMRSAIQAENLSIVAQGLACGDIHAKKASKNLKARALATLAD